MSRWIVRTSNISFLTVCDYHIDAIRTARVYEVEPLLTTQGFDPGWGPIRRENLTVGAEDKQYARKVKRAKSR